ncbi:probable G-protein coupled receptor 139 [Heterodontus francisci]|uniref:probable G-protein coupled receptor 139 n=1 Tax=Heterodontus francisci TaxID=7792 RepID=UPI00355B0E48
MGSSILTQIEEIYYPLLALLGIPANLVTIVILSRGKCGLSKCITIYLVAMAAADLLVLIVDVLLYEMNEIYFPESFLDYTPVCSLNFFLIFASIECSVWLTVAFTFDRFIAICCQKIRTHYCTERTAAVVVATMWGLSILENIPISFTFEPRIIIDDVLWFCNVKSSLYTVPIWVAFLWVDIALMPFIPFLLILIFNGLTIRHILLTNRIRRGLRSSSSDPEMENRRKSIVLLLAISGSFILLWMVTFTHYICVQILDIQYLHTDYSHPFTIMEQTGYMLQHLSSCTNTIIYAVSQTKFRLQLKNLFKYPLVLIKFGK